MNSVYQFIQTSLQTSLRWLVSWMERSSVFKQRVIITEYKILRVCTSSPLVLSSPFACLTQSRIKIDGKCSCGFYIYANFSVQR